MAYQQVTTPRFMCDIFLLLKTLGIGNPEPGEDVFTLNPTNQKAWGSVGLGYTDIYFDYRNLPSSGVNLGRIGYIAYLGHDLLPNTTGGTHFLSFRWKNTSMSSGVNLHDYINSDDEVMHVNYANGNNLQAGPYKGFSICVFSDADESRLDEFRNVTHANFRVRYTDIFTIGCASIGSVYEMTNAPNLSLTMSRDYGGTKEFTTYNGSSMSNTMHTGAPKWGGLGAWELGAGAINQNLARSGRRSWSLKFSYMGDSDLWGSNQSIGTYAQTTTGYGVDTTTDAVSGYDLTEGYGSFSSWSGGSPERWDFGNDAGDDPTTGHGFVQPLDGGGNLTGRVRMWSLDGINTYMNNTDSAGAANSIFKSGLKYRVSIRIININIDGGAVRLGVAGGTIPNNQEHFNGNIHDNLFFNTEGTHEFDFIAQSNGHLQIKRHSPPMDITFDNVTVQILHPTGFEYNLLSDDNFFSQVWHKTLGGTLPFLFQPDKDNNNPDQFCIARFKKNSLKATQTAHNVYDISLDIEEVW